jgi:hypothetical protein
MSEIEAEAEASLGHARCSLDRRIPGRHILARRDRFSDLRYHRHVRRDSGLPSVLRTPQLQHQPMVSVLSGLVGRDQFATRTDLVGSGPSRHHHRHPDTEDDWHTPLHGFWHAHNGWLESPHILDVSYDRVPDLTRYPEMRFIDTFYHIPALLMIATLAAIGSYLQAHYPALGTSAWQMVVWGFFVRTVIVWHLTFTTNSVLHLWGSRRFDTNDNSRNSYVLSDQVLGGAAPRARCQDAAGRRARRGARSAGIDV